MNPFFRLDQSVEETKMVVRMKESVSSWDFRQIADSMKKEAEYDGYIPSEVDSNNEPVIYLRGLFNPTCHNLAGTCYIMFVKKVGPNKEKIMTQTQLEELAAKLYNNHGNVTG